MPWRMRQASDAVKPKEWGCEISIAMGGAILMDKHPRKARKVARNYVEYFVLVLCTEYYDEDCSHCNIQMIFSSTHQR